MKFEIGQVVKFNPFLDKDEVVNHDIFVQDWMEAILSGRELTVHLIDSACPYKSYHLEGFASGDAWWVPEDMLLDPLELTMAQGVAFTNLTFGNKTLSLEDPNFWSRAKTQAQLIQEELNEIFEAIENKDLKMLRDGNCDVEVTSLGLSHICGIDIERDMKAVLTSNLSKVCKTEEDAEGTQEFYRIKKGVKTRLEQCQTFPGFVVKVDGDQTGSDGKFYPNNKFLKCIYSFKEPQFEG